MNQNEFNVLSADLRKLAKVIPLNWGHVQKNRIDDRIDMFAINSYSELEREIAHLPEDKKNYLEEDGIYGNALNVMNIFFTRMIMLSKTQIDLTKLGMFELTENSNLISKGQASRKI